ncbi:MAG: hypothetical protein ACP59X_15250 [Solidesulfovibrio sp. DCME]|uniref:hypothetical protein n=1 Tax=Solidesulfovibrio sp. DCME TaxID=3447380 RepID=UPI003D0E2DEC
MTAGKGVVPEAGWLCGSGLECDFGLLPDEGLRTTDERVFAAGDLAQSPDLIHGDRRVNAVWPVAVEQGRVAALNMAGLKAAYAGSMAMNAIPVFGSNMISVGAVNPALTKGCDELTAAPLIEAIKAGKIRSAVGVVGCNNPKVKQDYQNANLIRECIKRDLLVLVTGCVTVSTGKQGLLVPEAADLIDSRIRAKRQALGLAP